MSRADPDLVERAVRALSRGPLPARELARRIMGLEGPLGPTEALVRTLLGGDARFRRGEDGVWALVEDAGPGGPSLGELEFAVVDLETTGSAFHRGHRVTEVAVVLIRGGVVSDTFVTLVNPGRRLPPRIQDLTGITDAMVERAPYFDVVADQILDHLRDRVFVAHNAPFDWGFLRGELAQAMGEVPDVPRLCTVRLSRALLPRLGRYHLDTVARHFGVPVEGRHRARGDAVATARVLLRLLDRAHLEGVRGLEALLGVMEAGRGWGRIRGNP